MYTTGENRVWTAKDEREQRSEYKRATRATRKHLGQLQNAAGVENPDERSFLNKLLRRKTTDPADLPPESRPLPPAAKQEPEPRWWNRSERGHRPSASQDFQALVQTHAETQADVRRAVTVTANTRVPPPIPPRYDLMHQPPPDRPRRKSEHDAAARRRARETALRHLEKDHDCRKYMVVDRADAPPAALEPGTWIPGQLNPVHFDQEPASAHYVDEHGVTTPQLYDHFPAPPRTLPLRKAPPTGPLPVPPPLPTPLPPTKPLNIVRRRDQEARNIPIPPIPAEPKSNRDSFLELRRKRSYRV